MSLLGCPPSDQPYENEDDRDDYKNMYEATYGVRRHEA
jgi:hypothetical protein